MCVSASGDGFRGCSASSSSSTCTVRYHHCTNSGVLAHYKWRHFIYPGELAPEETLTHSHLSCSSAIFYQLPPSTMIHSILPDQFKCMTDFSHNLSPSPLWSTSWSGTLCFILHTFLHQSLPSFCNTCPYRRNLFCGNIEIVSSTISSLCLYHITNKTNIC